MTYTDDEQAFIERFAAGDAPPNPMRVALMNVVTPDGDRQKSSALAIRVRVGGAEAEEFSSVAKYTDDFDLYMVDLYDWMAIPAVDLPDIKLRMAQALELRILNSMAQERAYNERKAECIASMKLPGATGEPIEAMSRGLNPPAPAPAAPPSGVPAGAMVHRFADHEPSSMREKYVVERSRSGCCLASQHRHCALTLFWRPSLPISFPGQCPPAGRPALY
ncbi:hypothetical protein T492DRAFT_1124282 [Pavlovales sp. CCMP2436]|nr:hypothetical protein T492DRAFT_1124282 [Pavlovales sp. CCMP2436]